MLYRTLYCAVVAGVLAGIILFALQHWTTLPLIHQAERYEKTETAAHPSPQASDAPEDGPEVGQVDVVRAAYTTVGDVLVAAGFGMLLTAMYALSGKFGLVRGIRLGPRWLCHLSFRARPGGSTVVAGPRRRSIAFAAKRMARRSDIDRPRTCDFRLWTARRKARRRRGSLLAHRAVPLPVPASRRASTLGSSFRARASFHRAPTLGDNLNSSGAGSRCLTIWKLPGSSVCKQSSQVSFPRLLLPPLALRGSRQRVAATRNCG